MVVMVSSDGQADRTTSSPHLGHGVVRTAWSLEAGQLDAVPPRATPKSVKHCLTPLNIVILMSVTDWQNAAGERGSRARTHLYK